jgi:hypothetical protein
VPASVLPVLLAAAGLAAGAAAALTSRLPAPAQGTSVLAYGARARAAAGAALALPFLAAALAAWRLPPAEEPVRFWTLVAGSAAALLLLWVVRVEVCGVRHVVAEDALVGGSAWGKPVRLAWDGLRAVRWSAANQWFELEGEDGRVRVSRWLTGLPALAAALEARGKLAEGVADAASRARLGVLAARARQAA